MKLHVYHSGFIALLLGLSACTVYAQSFGVESHNTLMPASGGMAGTSIARPQDLTSSINANPATLTQFGGTQFTFGGAWAEATLNIDQTAPLPLLGVQPFAGKSQALGVMGVERDEAGVGRKDVSYVLDPGHVFPDRGVGDLEALLLGVERDPDANGLVVLVSTSEPSSAAMKSGLSS